MHACIRFPTASLPSQTDVCEPSYGQKRVCMYACMPLPLEVLECMHICTHVQDTDSMRALQGISSTAPPGGRSAGTLLRSCASVFHLAQQPPGPAPYALKCGDRVRRQRRTRKDYASICVNVWHSYTYTYLHVMHVRLLMCAHALKQGMHVK